MIKSYAQTTFKNEYGRGIGITVEDKDGGALITMSSPDTLYELQITLAEIYALYETMGDFLNQHQRNNPGN